MQSRIRVLKMKKYLTLLILCTTAQAQVITTRVGNTVFTPNGIYNRVGNTTFGPNGYISNQVGDTTFSNAEPDDEVILVEQQLQIQTNIQDLIKIRRSYCGYFNLNVLSMCTK